jgi:PAS domain S-box-containing protein
MCETLQEKRNSLISVIQQGPEKVEIDISERNRFEKALYKEKEIFRIFIEGLPLGISLIGKDGHYEYINPKFIEIFGYNLTDINNGREWFKKAFPDSEYRHQAVSTWFEYLKEIEAAQSRPRIFNVRCKDGIEKIIKFRSIMIETGHQIVIYEDIATPKRLEAQLQQSQKMEAIGTLAGGIAHDFNNILMAIMGNAEICLYSLQEQSPERFSIEQILKASVRARDLIKQILTFSRQTEHELKPIKISIVVQEALRLLRASLPTSIEIRQRITAGRDTVLADPTQIHQVLMNLCANAHHAMREEGGILGVILDDVDINFENALKYPFLKQGPYIKLRVGDSGCGIEPEDMNRIFEPYFTTKAQDVGTGMGLALVHGIVKSHGGAVKVESQPGKGATFDIFFPLIEKEDQPVYEVLEKSPPGNERILFVDDEKTIADLGKRMIEILGYKVDIRTSSIEALNAFKAKSEKYDLVITDMTMPNMTGEKLSKELMRIRPDVPIILCSGFSEMITENRAREIGIKGYIMKPFVMHEIAKTIRQALGKEK